MSSIKNISKDQDKVKCNECDKKLNKNYMRKHKKTMHNLNDEQENPINMNGSPEGGNSNNEKDSYFCSFCMETFETSEDLDDHT